ncbi:uncharacterized protein LOC143242682 [Tachypleus tridentatus]|uniref:uncharacterized protein LOC143242682 n=1 Tax=Tachypleus tridentatus TaxID=6853 RepID=UPI003FD3E53C
MQDIKFCSHSVRKHEMLKYKNKNKVPPIKKVEKRSGRSSKNLKSKKTMEAYTSICSENAQSEEIKGKSRFSMRGRTYPPLKISGLYSFTSSEDEPQDPEVIWLSQKKQRKYSVNKKKNKSKNITRRKSSGTDWSDIEKFELTVEPSSVSKTRMRLSRSDNKSKDTQKELTQLVHEASHDNSGIDASVIHSVNMVSSTEELSAQKDSIVLSDSLEKIKSVSSGNKTGITQKEYSCKGLCGLGMEDKSDNIIQKARFGTVPESEILVSKNTESLNIDTKSRTDCTENKSEQKLNTTCIQEEKQHSMLEKNCSVRHHASPIRYPDVSSSSDELVSFASFKQSFGEELHKKFRTLLQELVSPEQLRSRPFKWRNSDLGSPDIIPLNNSPETDFVLSPVGRSEKFSFDTTWPNLKHEKRLMMTTPGPYTPTQKVYIFHNHCHGYVFVLYKNIEIVFCCMDVCVCIQKSYVMNNSLLAVAYIFYKINF